AVAEPPRQAVLAPQVFVPDVEVAGPGRPVAEVHPHGPLGPRLGDAEGGGGMLSGRACHSRKNWSPKVSQSPSMRAFRRASSLIPLSLREYSLPRAGLSWRRGRGETRNLAP